MDDDNKGLLWLYFSYYGRIARVRFLLHSLLIYIVIVVAGLASGIAAEKLYIQNEIQVFLFLLFIYFEFALNFKRLHDLDKSGILFMIFPVFIWSVVIYVLVTAKPGYSEDAQVTWFIIGLTYLSLVKIYLLIWPGTKGENRYGDDPIPEGKRITERIRTVFSDTEDDDKVSDGFFSSIFSAVITIVILPFAILFGIWKGLTSKDEDQDEVK